MGVDSGRVLEGVNGRSGRGSGAGCEGGAAGVGCQGIPLAGARDAEQEKRRVDDVLAGDHNCADSRQCRTQTPMADDQ